MARAPLPEEQLATARRKAATAATTLPPSARLYTALPPPDADTGSCSRSKVSSGKATALASARKHLDERWVVEQRELQPELGQLWVAAERLAQQPAPVALPQLHVPLPDPRLLVAGFLGLRM